MYTKNLLKAKVTGVLLGVASLFMAGVSNAATVSVLPATQTAAIGDTITASVTGSGFLDGATGGSILVSWDTTVLTLLTTQQDTQIDGILNTGWGSVPIFDTTVPGTLEFTALLTNGDDPAIGVGGAEFVFVNLDFSVLATTPTNIGVAPGSFGDWQDGNNTSVLDVTYVPGSVNVSAVPVPAAVWLFGSGLIGMIAVSRRRKPQLVC